MKFWEAIKHADTQNIGRHSWPDSHYVTWVPPHVVKPINDADRTLMHIPKEVAKELSKRGGFYVKVTGERVSYHWCVMTDDLRAEDWYIHDQD